MHRFVSLVVLLSWLTQVPAQETAARPATIEAIEAICDERMSADGPGFAVVVSKDGDVLHRAAYGLADVATKTPLRVEQPFYVASVAKVFTAACIHHLAQNGKITLEDEIRKHVPELPEHCKGITLRHLLHHRSGLRDFYELEWLASRNPTELTSRGVLDLLRRQRGTNFAPGSDFLYCNSGYLLLAEVVARASKHSLHAYAREHLFAPLSMSASVFRDAEHQDVKGLPSAYDDDAASLQPPLLCGAGGLCASADDLHRWLTALSGAKWQPELVNAIVTPPVLRPDQRRSPQLEPYAGGMFVTTVADQPAWLMRGGFGGWQAAAMVLPRSRVHAIVLANHDMDALGTVRALVRAVLGAEAAARPENDAKPGFNPYRAADGELLFVATRSSGPTFLTTLGWKIEVAAKDGVMRSFDASTNVAARKLPDGGLELQIEGEPARTYAPFAMQRVDAGESEAIAGVWRGDEIDADLTLLAEGGKLRADATRMMQPIAPFLAIDRDTWVSDTGLQIEVRRSDGKPVELRISTARARGMVFTRK